MAYPPRRVVLTMESRGYTELPLSEVVRNGQLQVLPVVEQRGLLFLQFRKGQLIVTAGKYVGLVPLTHEISIEIRPKLPVSNIARVLDRARVSLDPLREAERLYLRDGAQSDSIVEFLLSNLTASLRGLWEFGVHKEYVRHEDLGSNPRGRIMVSKTLKARWSRGVEHKVISERFEQTSDVAVNRVLKGGLEHLLRGCNRISGAEEKIRAGNRAYNNFPSEIGPVTMSDYTAVRGMIDGRNLSKARTYYYRPLEIALLALSRRGLNLDATSGDFLLDSFIVDFEDVFETYLRRTLQLEMPGTVSVQDGNAEGKKPLYDDRQEPPAQPDIVITSRDTGLRLIVEVKYKDKPSREDVNQAVTYAVSYRTDRVILAHQRKKGGPSGLRLLGVVNGINVHAYAFDLSNDDLLGEERDFVGHLSEMLLPIPAQVA